MSKNKTNQSAFNEAMEGVSNIFLIKLINTLPELKNYPAGASLAIVSSRLALTIIYPQKCGVGVNNEYDNH